MSARRVFATALLRLLGWRAEGTRPAAPRCVVVAAPHTSNWDFPLLVLFAWHFEVPIAYVGKEELFRGPLGVVMRRLGGVPVRRQGHGGLVPQLAAALRDGPERALVIPAEGSRAWCPHWRSGFYHVAREAGVPVALSFLDYGRRVGGFGPCFLPTGDVRADMEPVRRFYADKQGLFPECFGPVRLLEEDEAPAGESAPQPLAT